MSRNASSNEDQYPRCLMLENETSNFNSNEDFCTICQKHFCNKYYLKKHKLDVHKTLSMETMDNTISSYNQNMLHNDNALHNTNYNSDINYIKHIFSQMADRIRKGKEIEDTNLYNYPNKKESIIRKHSLESSFPFPLDLHDSSINKSKFPSNDLKFYNLNFSNLSLPWHVCYICNIRFRDELSLSTHCNSAHRTESDTINNVSNSQRRFFQNIQFLSGQPTTQIDEFLSNNALDAFKYSMAAAKLADRVSCDICGKDLCNKYFLRTHRKKVHGIKFDVMKSGILCHNSIYGRDRLELKQTKDCLINNTENEVTLINETKSNLWNQFQFSLDPDDRKIIKVESKYPVPSMSHTFHNKQYTFDTKKCKWIRKPLANKVKCDICDRLICNKYFLKTHKYKKHGIQEQMIQTQISNNNNNNINNNNNNNSYKDSSEYDCNGNPMKICNSLNNMTALPNNFLDYKDSLNEMEKRTFRFNKIHNRNQILIQKEEPLDLSIPKPNFNVCATVNFCKTKKPYEKSRILSQRNIRSTTKMKNINFYKRLISKYLGIRKIRFICKT